MFTNSKIIFLFNFHSYLNTAREYINYLQKYENASKDLVEIKEGEEDNEFISIWFDTKEKFESFNKNHFSEIVNEWNHIYRDVDISARIEEELKKKNKIILENSLGDKNNKDLEKIPIKIRKAFYVYPEEDNPENLIDLDDLSEEDFFVACLDDTSENKFNMFIWKGSSVNIDSEETEIYINKIKNNFFPEENRDKVIITEETPYNESDEFMNML